MSQLSGNSLKLVDVFPSGQTFGYTDASGNPGTIGNNGSLPFGSTLTSAPEAGGRLEGTDASSQAVPVVSFSDAEPVVFDEVNWDVVTQVDEYYEDPGFRYDVGFEDTNSDTVFIGIRG